MPRRFASFCCAAAASFALACGRGEPVPEQVTTTPQAVVVATAEPAAPPAATAPPAPSGVDSGVLTALEAGDRACYVTVTAADGERSLEGDFELCAGGASDATSMIGQPVTWQTRRERVQAASCQGNPDCPDSEEVDLVVAISPGAP
jgi:hypothetical protein